LNLLFDCANIKYYFIITVSLSLFYFFYATLLVLNTGIYIRGKKTADLPANPPCVITHLLCAHYVSINPALLSCYFFCTFTLFVIKHVYTLNCMSVNKVILVGNVGKDPEVRYLEKGVAVARFPLATSETYKGKDGERVTATEWHNIVLWRGLAETVEKYVRKGSQLYIEGRIRNRSYDDKEGNKKYLTEIVADQMQMLGKRSDSQGDENIERKQAASGQTGESQQYGRPAPANTGNNKTESPREPLGNASDDPFNQSGAQTDDDLPF